MDNIWQKLYGVLESRKTQLSPNLSPKLSPTLSPTSGQTNREDYANGENPKKNDPKNPSSIDKTQNNRHPMQSHTENVESAADIPLATESAQTHPKKSYVASLYQKGDGLIMSKIKEEMMEVEEVITTKNPSGNTEDKKHLIHEICDLLFHSLVLAADKKIQLSEIEAELERRVWY